MTEAQGFPRLHSRLTDQEGNVAQPWLQFFVTLWMRTGAAINSVVSSVSIVNANGVSGTVADSTTTPAITIVLGNITPASVNASGVVIGSNLSGTNTGDQTINLSGDISGSGTSGIATTLATVNPNVGTFTAATVTADGKGRITAISDGGGITTVIATAKLTGGGANGTMTFVNGILTAQLQAT